MSKKEFYPTFGENEEFNLTFGGNKKLNPTFKEEGEFDLKFGRVSINSYVSPDYNLLDNKPKIENNELTGDKTFKQLGLDTLSVQEIEKILYL